MTQEELKFLEIIYNRGSIQEQPYINYLSGTLPREVNNKDQYVKELVSKFRDHGFIDHSSSGTYRITDLGKEKFEQVNERREPVTAKRESRLERIEIPKIKKVKLDRRFWLALVILVVIVSVIASMILNRITYLSDFLRKFVP